MCKANVNTSTVLNDNEITTGQVPKHCYLRPMILAKVHISLGRRANFKANSNVFVKEFNTKGTWTQGVVGADFRRKFTQKRKIEILSLYKTCSYYYLGNCIVKYVDKKCYSKWYNHSQFKEEGEKMNKKFEWKYYD